MDKPRSFPDWERLYREQAPESMPWHYPGVDPDFARFLDQEGISSGDALDIGCGTGSQALALARRGFRVTATDVSLAAVERAREKSLESGLTARFLHDNILCSELHNQYDLILDRGCFHVFHRAGRKLYIDRVADLLRPGGVFLMKCFSKKEKRPEGPYRFSPEEISDLFGKRFIIRSVTETLFQGTLPTFPIALFCILDKK